MKGKTALRQVMRIYIQKLRKGTKFTYTDLYERAERTVPGVCAWRGDAPNEPRYKHDIRAAVWDAMRLGWIRHTGIRGERERL